MGGGGAERRRQLAPSSADCPAVAAPAPVPLIRAVPRRARAIRRQCANDCSICAFLVAHYWEFSYAVIIVGLMKLTCRTENFFLFLWKLPAIYEEAEAKTIKILLEPKPNIA